MYLSQQLGFSCLQFSSLTTFMELDIYRDD